MDLLLFLCVLELAVLMYDMSWEGTGKVQWHEIPILCGLPHQNCIFPLPC